MRISRQFSILAVGAVLAFGVAALPAAFAFGDPAKPAASPKPDTQQKKVWTNDDVERLNPDFVAVSGKKTTVESAAPATVTVAPAAAQPARVAVAVPLAPEKNPAWYGQQLAMLQEQLSAVEGRENELRNFRNTATGLPTGLILNAPCTGITTDNLIANLDAQRQEILAQIDALGDLARSNGLPPGILVEGRGLVQTAVQPSMAEQRTTVTEVVRGATAQLADVQATVASMQDQAASLNAALQQPTPGFGGNMTTDLLERLGGQAAALQDAIDSAGDAARTLGMAPGDLR